MRRDRFGPREGNSCWKEWTMMARNMLSSRKHMMRMYVQNQNPAKNDVFPSDGAAARLAVNG